MHRRLAKIAACLCKPSMKLINTLSFLLFVFTRSNNSKYVSTWSPSCFEAVHSSRTPKCWAIAFSPSSVVPSVDKNCLKFPLGRGHRICCLVGTSSFLFFVYTMGVQSIHVDLVIFRIHVETLMLVCGLVAILLNRGKELDIDIFLPCCWSQLLHKHCYPYFPCAIPWQKLPNMVWVIFNAFASFKELWLTGATYGWRWFL